MAAKTHRRNYIRRPGLTEAAIELGCTYSHLRRVVLHERKTPLLDRFHALMRRQGADPASDSEFPTGNRATSGGVNQKPKMKGLS